MRPSRAIAIELVVASFLVLFQELTLIRWVATQVRVISYFPNVILLSAFLGIGLGCLRSGRRSLAWLWPTSLLVLMGATFLMRGVVFTQLNPTEHLWLLYYDLPHTARIIHSIELPILLVFILSAATFVPLGQIVAERIQLFRERNSSLSGYTYDLVGSLVGVVAFGLVCMSQIRPVYWFAELVILGGVFLLRKRPSGVAYVLMSLAIVVMAATMDRDDAYSPYYSLRKQPAHEGQGFQVLTNGSLHQIALNMARGASGVTEFNAIAREGYHVPYNMLGSVPRTALVFGAGTGNDVAALLDRGVGQIDAVEIDPVIMKWGAEHPNVPYASPRVNAINTDARSYLSNCRKHYDLIVFGTLDSQTRLSALSSVRLDNFVYTIETVRAAKKLLAADGGIVMYFMVGSGYIGLKIQAILTEAFGILPVVYQKHHMLFNTAFMAGPAFAGQQSPATVAASRQFIDQALPNINVPSDDWPFLYLQERRIGGFYLGLMAAIAGLSLLGVLLFSPEFRQSFGRRGSADWQMFLFGLSFLLLETRSVTAMNLLWGATWITSSVVFGSVLLMVLCATVFSRVKQVPFAVAAVGLILSLGIAYLLPSDIGLGLPVAHRLCVSALVVGVPILFASLCFASLFANRKQADQAFGWNLLGAVCGGLLEFLSMSVGLRSLLLLALAAYLTAVLLWMQEKRTASTAAS